MRWAASDLPNDGPQFRSFDDRNGFHQLRPMKRLFALFIVALLSLAGARAGTPKIEAVVAKDKESKPTDSFPADVPEVYAFFKSTGTKKGETLRAVWIAEDVGDAAPKETKIDESTLTADQDNFFGAFSLSKPTKGWPVGQYRVEIYSGSEVATTVKFEIKAVDAEEDSDEEEAEADSPDK